MSTLSSIIGARTKGDLAYEIEVEFLKDMPQDLIPGWLNKGDGSLRHLGVEYISNVPVKLANRRDHLLAVINEINKYKYVGNSPRTSVHLHVNCLTLTPIQIMNGLLFSWIIEESLIDRCGKERKNNRFCLSIRAAPLLFKNLAAIIYDNDYTFMANANRFKYANIAYHNLHTIGTIEFRGMEGDYSIERLTNWGEVCYNAIHLPSKFKHPLEMCQELFATRTALNRFFPYIDIDYDKAEENLYLLYNIIYGTDWDNYIANIPAGSVRKKKAISAYDMDVDLAAEMPQPARGIFYAGNNLIPRVNNGR